MLNFTIAEMQNYYNTIRLEDELNEVGAHINYHQEAVIISGG